MRYQGEERVMSKIAVAVACVVVVAATPALAAPHRQIPNFATDSRTGWVKTPGSDEFIQPKSGPGPVQDDPAYPYESHGHPGDGGDPNGQETVKIADITNPILQPWAAEQMKKANEAVLAGKIGFTARARCWPAGVPGFLTYPVTPLYFIQSPTEVVITWGQDFQLRRVHLNVPHSANPRPSWFGESVGHYENGDTLVIDTIGFVEHPLSFVDNYRTPHTKDLHVIERWKLIEGGTWIEVEAKVVDPGAFTTPWTAVQRYRRVEEGGLREQVCSENNVDHFNQNLEPIPQDDSPDF
jgi:hypothetical protein